MKIENRFLHHGFSPVREVHEFELALAIKNESQNLKAKAIFYSKL